MKSIDKRILNHKVNLFKKINNSGNAWFYIFKMEDEVSNKMRLVLRLPLETHIHQITAQ